MASGGSCSSSSSGGTLAAAATVVLEVASWASRRRSACSAIEASSSYPVKSVMDARTASGRRCNQTARIKSMLLEDPEGSGGRRARARNSLSASEGVGFRGADCVFQRYS